MKRIGNLFDSVVERKNLIDAFLKASRGKRHRPDQRAYEANLDEETLRLRAGLLDGTYRVGDYTRFTIFDPKEREICAAPFAERVLQHALMNVCEGYFDRWLVDDSYASRKGRGQTAAVARARQFAGRYGWFLKCDIRKYFDSIPHAGVRRMLRRKFKDERLLTWFDRIIDTYETSPAHGLPIGNLTSQHFANLYLDGLDRLRSGDVGYVRYMDDFVFWSDDKNVLLNLRKRAAEFACDELGLELKENAFVNRTGHGMDFLGMRVFPRMVKLNRSSRTRYVRSCKALHRLLENGTIGENECQVRLTSLMAFASQADSLAWRRRTIEQYGF